MFKNSYQIDFLDIGDKESGDCIILQWNNIFNKGEPQNSEKIVR